MSDAVLTPMAVATGVVVIVAVAVAVVLGADRDRLDARPSEARGDAAC